MSNPPSPDENRTLIDDLLAEQRSLTAVNRFAQRHAQTETPLQQRYYRDLLPLSKVQAGQQYSFEVDLDKCSGCKACVTACHNLNGLEENETWRRVGLIIGKNGVSEQRTVTTACHHCVDPACLNGCPVLAYDKDPVTGIVRHLDDQCIGCQYCVLKCPYDVPQYSSRLGIVRKCDMCSSRLAVDEAPACVQACPNEAIAIRVVYQHDLIAAFRGDDAVSSVFLATAPESSYTVPSTRYTTKNPAVQHLEAADLHHAALQPAHWPLVWMLVLMQAAAGTFFVHAVVRPWLAPPANFRLLVAGLIWTMLGLVVSVLHLGRPAGAWRVFLGWRRSWLSREAMIFGGLAKLAIVAPLALWLRPEWHSVHTALAWSLVLAGILGTVASVMVYHDTQRRAWGWKVTGPKFFGAAAILGLATTAAIIAFTGPTRLADVQWLGAAIAVCSMAKLAWELRLLRRWTGSKHLSLQKSARLIAETVPVAARSRNALILVGGLLLPVLFALQPRSLPTAGAVLLTLIAAELAERFLFFTTVAPDKMPGGFR